MIEEVIWQEKYRPQKLDDIIGQDAIIKRLKASVERGNIQHLLFSGIAGVGKTTTAIALAKELFGNEWKSNFKELNGSDDRGIDVIRNQVKEFAGAQSLGKAGFKIILLDEADSLCLDENTEILIGTKNDNRNIKIKDASQNTYIDMPSLNVNSGVIEEDKGKCIDSGNVEMFKITLENGKEIIASSEHPFFKLDERGETIEIKTKELDSSSKILDFENELFRSI
jgi:replication factor C small subunit